MVSNKALRGQEYEIFIRLLSKLKVSPDCPDYVFFQRDRQSTEADTTTDGRTDRRTNEKLEQQISQNNR